MKLLIAFLSVLSLASFDTKAQSFEEFEKQAEQIEELKKIENKNVRTTTLLLVSASNFFLRVPCIPFFIQQELKENCQNCEQSEEHNHCIDDLITVSNNITCSQLNEAAEHAKNFVKEKAQSDDLFVLLSGKKYPDSFLIISHIVKKISKYKGCDQLSEQMSAFSKAKESFLNFTK